MADDRNPPTVKPGELLEHATSMEGVQLGRYQLGNRIGGGGMGEVFEARRLDGQEVALKTLTEVSATNLYRFKREFRALADVEHPNLVRLYELGVTSDGLAFFTMERVIGEPFVDWVRAGVPEGELPDLERLESALLQLVQGVHALHELGCVHRDLKPSNVLVSEEGRVVILDFGLLSAYTAPEFGITRQGQAMGTPSHMAPEQAMAERTGPPADYYAIGVMLFTCLTGRLPYKGSALLVLAGMQNTVDTEAELAKVPAAWRERCLSLMHREPRRRATGPQLLAALDADPRLVEAREPLDIDEYDEAAVDRLLHTQERLSAHGEPLIMHLRGRAGAGKTAVLIHARALLRERGCLILHARCNDRERVPYKGIDAIVDGLSAYLRRQSGRKRIPLEPGSVAALVGVFPVLGGLWPEPDERVEPGSWTEALRELLTIVAARESLVIEIDELQWADTDSIAALAELFTLPEAPRALLILAYRTEVDSVVLERLEANPAVGPRAAELIELDLPYGARAEAPPERRELLSTEPLEGPAEVVRRMLLAVVFEEFERGWTELQRLQPTGDAWTDLHAAMLATVLTAEHMVEASWLERVQLRLAWRRHHAALVRGVQQIGTACQPLLAIDEGERANIAGRFAEGMRHYERARQTAGDAGMWWLAGLASARLAVWATRAGQVSAREAAVVAARDGYRRWGAVELVRRIDTGE